MKKKMAMIMMFCLLVSVLAGCGGKTGGSNGAQPSGAAEGAGAGAQAESGTAGAQAGAGADAQAAGKKTMTIGDTTFNPENAEPDVNPHNDYAGWATIRYGIGETLFKLSDDMELTPWHLEDHFA